MTELVDDELTEAHGRVTRVFFDYPRQRMTADRVATHAHLRCPAVVPILRWLEHHKLIDAELLPAGRDEGMLRGYQLTLRGVRELVPAFHRKGWLVPPGIDALVPNGQPATRAPATMPPTGFLTTHVANRT